MHCFRNFYKLLCLGCLLALVLATRKYSPSSSLFVPTLYADLELPAAALATEQRLGFLFVARNGDPLEAMGRNTRAFEALVGYELYKYGEVKAQGSHTPHQPRQPQYDEVQLHRVQEYPKSVSDVPKHSHDEHG